jgi:hypothetical protein
VSFQKKWPFFLDAACAPFPLYFSGQRWCARIEVQCFTSVSASLLYQFHSETGICIAVYDLFFVMPLEYPSIVSKELIFYPKHYTKVHPALHME